MTLFSFFLLSYRLCYCLCALLHEWGVDWWCIAIEGWELFCTRHIEVNWHLLRATDFEEWMVVLFCRFTPFAVVEIWAHCTFVAWSKDGRLVAAVAGNAVVYSWGLLRDCGIVAAAAGVNLLWLLTLHKRLLQKFREKLLNFFWQKLLKFLLSYVAHLFFFSFFLFTFFFYFLTFLILLLCILILYLVVILLARVFPINCLLLLLLLLNFLNFLYILILTTNFAIFFACVLRILTSVALPLLYFWNVHFTLFPAATDNR